MIGSHTDRSYAQELHDLQDELQAMASHVVKLLDAALRAYAAREVEAARTAMLLDREVNTRDKDLTARCLTLLARRQPMGSDLRFITQALKMVGDLERVGDLAVNVCERVIQLDGARFGDTNLRQDMLRMGNKGKEMVEDAIDAFMQRDDEVARDVLDDDEEVDGLYSSVFLRALEEMRGHPELVEPGIHVMSIAKVLERIADHATNLAEQAVFMVGGEDIRHTGKRVPPGLD